MAWLALFALACQLVIAFGHVHPGKAAGVSGAPAIVVDLGSSPSPPHQKPTGLADGFCAICTNISLAGTLVVPTSPTVALPISVAQQLPWQLVAVEPVAFDHVLFDARGPPAA